MLELRFIRENPDLVKKAIELKNIDLDLEQLLAVDNEVLTLKREIEALQGERNRNAKMASTISPEERAALIEKGKVIGTKLAELEPNLRDLESKLRELLLKVPQIPHEKAPIGPDESGNVEIERIGTPRTDAVKDHVTLLEENGWAELERIAKVAGTRSYALKGDLVLYEQAVLHFALAQMIKSGFTLLSTPSMAREMAFLGTGHFPAGRGEVYGLEDDLFLAGTGEVTTNALHSGEILHEEDLPLLYATFSPCFRAEAGAAGRDTRGLMRVHQFLKVEQYVLCKAEQAESERWFDILLHNSRQILEAFELPYRVLETCTGDMGAGKVRMVDLEAWVPSENRYRETHSCSSFYDWQARRANLRYRDSEGKVRFAYTLNNTAIATPRILVMLLENHQQNDRIYIPKALQPYMNNRLKHGDKEFLTPTLKSKA